MQMTFFLVLFLIYGLPIGVGIFLIYLLLRDLTPLKVQIRKKIIRFLILASLLFLGGVYGYDWYSKQHSASFALTKNYTIDLEMEEIDGFQDYAFHYKLHIINTANKHSQDFEFTTADGSYNMEFSCAEKQATCIFIEDVGMSRGFIKRWKIPLKKDMLESKNATNSNSAEQVLQVVRLNQQDQVKHVKKPAASWQKN